MHWLNENLAALMLLFGSLTLLLIVYSWGDGVPLMTVIKRIPNAFRLVIGSLLLLGFANFIMWTPGIVTGFVAAHYLGDWGLVFAWPGLIFGFWLLKLVHEPILKIYRLLSGNKD